LEIGEKSVVGAGSVVTKFIPPFSVAAGVPAKIRKKLSIWPDKEIIHSIKYRYFLLPSWN
jgi:acetyltransferase-like isoleucine patch superfamily enzyme